MRYFILISVVILALKAELPSLSTKDFQLIKAELEKLESKGTGGINVENKRGYLGKYQFGAAAIAAVGLVDKKKYNASIYYDKKRKTKRWKAGITNKSFLSKRSNWEIPKGKDDFLGNASLQEQAIDRLIRQNYLSLSKEKLNITKQELFGFLIAAHLGGYTHALDYLKNKSDFKDALGTSISKYYLVGTKIKSSIPSASIPKELISKLATVAKNQLGKEYLWGGTDPNSGADCSGYMQYIFKDAGVKLPRTAWQQSKIGKKISINELHEGDLLFFNTDPKRGIPVTHVGMYLSKGKFIHAASRKQGIITSDFIEYKNKFVIAKRVLQPKQINSLNFFGSYLKKDATPKKAMTRVAFVFDPLIKVNGTYIRSSQR